MSGRHYPVLFQYRLGWELTNNTPARQRRKEQYDVDLDILHCCAYLLYYVLEIRGRSGNKPRSHAFCLASLPVIVLLITQACVKGLSTTVLPGMMSFQKISVNILSVESRLNHLLVDYALPTS